MTNHTLESLTVLSIAELRLLAIDLNIKPLDARKKSSFIDCILTHQSSFEDAVDYICQSAKYCNYELELYTVVDVKDTEIEVSIGGIDSYSGGSTTAMECIYHSNDRDCVIATLSDDIEFIKQQQDAVEIPIVDEMTESDERMVDAILTAINTRDLYKVRDKITIITKIDNWLRNYDTGMDIIDRLECIKQILNHWSFE